MNKIIFSKYSNERARRFALRTDIIQTEQGRRVRKKALYPEGEAHVSRIKKYEKALSECYSDSQFTMNRCDYNEDGAWLEYLTGETLEEQLDSKVLAGQLDEVSLFLLQYLEEVKKGFNETKFIMTDAFREVFGEAELPDTLRSGNIVDIDMVLNNVMAVNGWTLIDYEWTFEFPIPFDFVAYRILYYYLHGSSTRNGLLTYDLIRKLGITEEQEKIYSAMEKHFQERYIQRENKEQELHVPIRVLYDEMSPGIVKLTSLGLGLEDTELTRYVQLYYAENYAFSEEQSIKYDFSEKVMLSGDNDQVLDILSAKMTYVDRMNHCYVLNCQIYPEKKAVKYIRLDPAAQYCRVRQMRVRNDAEMLSLHATNGQLLASGDILFTNEDPWMIFELTGSNIEMSFEIQYLTAGEALRMAEEHMMHMQQKCTLLQSSLSLKEEQIRQMENTKVWKAYRKLRRD